MTTRIATFAVACALAGVAQADLINGSFEQGTDANADGWIRFGNTYREKLAPHTGEYSMKMFGNWTGGFNVSGAFQDFAITPGQIASCRGWGLNLSTDAMSGGNRALMKLIYRDAVGNDLEFIELNWLDALTPTDVYQFAFGSLPPAPAGTAYGSMFILFLQPEFAGGAAFYDDLSVSVSSTRTVSGKVDFGMDVPTGHVTFEFRDSMLNNVTTIDTVLDASGNYTINSPAVAGTYELAIKPKGFLRKNVSVNTAGNVTGANFVLVNGDIDNDNAITVFDYGILSDYFDKSNTDSDWKTVGGNGFAPVDADLDLDGAVTVFDYGVLSDNFDKSGDN